MERQKVAVDFNVDGKRAELRLTVDDDVRLRDMESVLTGVWWALSKAPREKREDAVCATVDKMLSDFVV